MNDYLILAGLFLMASVKYLVAMLALIPLNFGFLPSVITLVSGGMLGTVVIGLLEKKILALVKRRQAKKGKVKKKFSRFNKFLIWVKHKLGLFGIAFLTPLVLTVPVGTLMAVRIEKNFMKVLIYEFCSYLFWAVLVFGLYYGFGIKIHL